MKNDKPSLNQGEAGSEPAALDLLDGVPDATGDNMRAARLAAGLTLEQAAKLIGLSGRQALSKIEAGAGTSRERLALLLLSTGRHPSAVAMKLTPL